MVKKVLEVNNLTKKFGNFSAVDDISFSLKEGEILGLLGPNGAGKTTSIHMLLDVMSPTSGDIIYFGKKFREDRSGILKKINYSSAYISLPWFFTIDQVLSVFADLYEVPNKKKRIDKLLEEFEIIHLRKKAVHTLSAGERARLLLTKAFLNYPEIILLDEPTASLDPDIAVKIRKFLKKEQEEYKVSMLFTSHNMTEVEEMCDRVIFLNHGKIMAEDTPENLARQITDSHIEILIKDSETAEKHFKKNNINFLKDGNIFNLNIKTEEISKILTDLSSEKIEFQDISVNKPDLEDYFLKYSKGQRPEGGGK
ncbi:MAG: ABC transporter ATP-binding protein [Candidatus Levybacteria bacterium]|nr:ABC transporter ATP-binding protein [Candidatus Levybacteria bacterium]